MKRILVIDDSEVVRETLALILRRDFIVSQRSPGSGGVVFPGPSEDIDLLIFGLRPNLGVEVSQFLAFAAKAPFAVLFLVESKSAARALEERDRVRCLVKPFNPYVLLDEVGQLLSRENILSGDLPAAPASEKAVDSGTLEYPFLSLGASRLARRFAMAPLPLLIYGEIGCGQERVARGIYDMQPARGRPVTLNAAEINRDYLALKKAEITSSGRLAGSRLAVIIENLDKCSPAGQSLLLEFLERGEEEFGGLRLFTTSRADLLEKVYLGEFLEPLYYKLATLTLKLAPLRDRRGDIPRIAAWCAQSLARALGLGAVSFSTEAEERLSKYLWFGNVCEMETVIARTLAVYRKNQIEAGELVFDFSDEKELPDFRDEETHGAPAPQPKEETRAVSAPSAAPGGSFKDAGLGNGRARAIELNVLIHELAHELKNPMVTIKTFAQLLGDRYQDENFRVRFRDVVGGDIERMDDLLESMIEFADFSQPRTRNVALGVKLRGAVEAIHSECAKRQVRIRWKGDPANDEVRTDEEQLAYVLKNVLLAVLGQARAGSEIEMDLAQRGTLIISYLREGGRFTAITHYFHTSAQGAEETVLPLRILLSKELLERNGGRMIFDQSDSERDIVKMEFTLA
jgi:DNA-binding NtrC family response regulator